MEAARLEDVHGASKPDKHQANTRQNNRFQRVQWRRCQTHRERILAAKKHYEARLRGKNYTLYVERIRKFSASLLGLPFHFQLFTTRREHGMEGEPQAIGLPSRQRPAWVHLAIW